MTFLLLMVLGLPEKTETVRVDQAGGSITVDLRSDKTKFTVDQALSLLWLRNSVPSATASSSFGGFSIYRIDPFGVVTVFFAFDDQFKMYVRAVEYTVNEVPLKE